MNERPVRIVVADDLRRSRLTVFFRLLLAIPHFFWIGIWSFGVFFTAIAQWFITVVRGRPAEPLHGFHRYYVRYATQLGAYLVLAANPYPGFLGDTDYPIDVEIDTVERQRRLSAAFRLFIALPALFMLAIVNGGGVGFAGSALLFSAGIVLTVAFLAWFVCLVVGAMPLGLRNVQAYGLRYTAEVYAYLLLLTDTYPSSDPTLPAEAQPPPAHPIRLDVRRRPATLAADDVLPPVPRAAALRLADPVVGARVAGGVRAVVRHARSRTTGGAAPSLPGGVASLPDARRSPSSGSSPARSPASPAVRAIRSTCSSHRPRARAAGSPASGCCSAIPAMILSGAIGGLLFAAAIGGWFAALAIGRMPLGLRNAGAHALRYSAQTNAYLILLTDRYPFSGPPALQPPEPERLDAAA